MSGLVNMTREQFEALHPFGQVNRQDGDEVIPLTQDEWVAWIDEQMSATDPLEAN